MNAVPNESRMPPIRNRYRDIFDVWWPLALSWFFMALELPAVSATMTRLTEPARHLAAFGGVTMPICFIIESPIIMLLSASTTLCLDKRSYHHMRHLMMYAGGVLTGVHALLALTPLYYLVVRDLLRVPVEILEPTRIGLVVMIPWTWAIAYRRFNQGIIIRFGNPRVVGFGTFIRIFGTCGVLLAGLVLRNIPGVIVGASGVIAGVVAEAAFIGWSKNRVLRTQIPEKAEGSPPLTSRSFFAFYIPLALTSFVHLAGQPLASGALSRMPLPLESLAVWPVVLGLSFMFRSTILSLPEVIVTKLDNPERRDDLIRFTGMVVAANSLFFVLLLATPLAGVWLETFSGLPAELSSPARTALLLSIPLPVLAGLQSWYQANLLFRRTTAPISQAVYLYFLVSFLVMGAGVLLQAATGIYIIMVAFLTGTIVQTWWLRRGMKGS